MYLVSVGNWLTSFPILFHLNFSTMTINFMSDNKVICWLLPKTTLLIKFLRFKISGSFGNINLIGISLLSFIKLIGYIFHDMFCLWWPNNLSICFRPKRLMNIVFSLWRQIGLCFHLWRQISLCFILWRQINLCFFL